MLRESCWSWQLFPWRILIFRINNNIQVFKNQASKQLLARLVHHVWVGPWNETLNWTASSVFPLSEPLQPPQPTNSSTLKWPVTLSAGKTRQRTQTTTLLRWIPLVETSFLMTWKSLGKLVDRRLISAKLEWRMKSDENDYANTHDNIKEVATWNPIVHNPTIL